MNVLVLGCGPAGLIAAHAAEEAGARVQIFSRKVKSVMPGAQYLHAPIPGVTPRDFDGEAPDGLLTVLKVGTGKGYAEKVYGDPEHPVSWDSYTPGSYMAWKLSTTYDLLWMLWEKRIQECDVNAALVREWSVMFDLVVSAIPAPALCEKKGQRDHHVFNSQRVWIVPRLVLPMVEEDTILYNGDVTDPWYRMSSIFGSSSTEFSVPVNSDDAWTGCKPTHTDCDCGPANLLRVGRFGRWEKQALLHQVYGQVQDALRKV